MSQSVNIESQAQQSKEDAICAIDANADHTESSINSQEIPTSTDESQGFGY